MLTITLPRTNELPFPPTSHPRVTLLNQIAKLLSVYQGTVKELHLSHNDITNEGAAQLLVQDVIQFYPVSVKNGLYQPLWLRLEQCRVNRRLRIPEWMYTPEKTRMKPQKDCPAVQIPHLELPVPSPNAHRSRPRALLPSVRPPQERAQELPPDKCVPDKSLPDKSEKSLPSYPPGSAEWEKQVAQQAETSKFMQEQQQRRQMLKVEEESRVAQARMAEQANAQARDERLEKQQVSNFRLVQQQQQAHRQKQVHESQEHQHDHLEHRQQRPVLLVCVFLCCCVWPIT